MQKRYGKFMADWRDATGTRHRKPRGGFQVQCEGLLAKNMLASFKNPHGDFHVYGIGSTQTRRHILREALPARPRRARQTGWP